MTLDRRQILRLCSSAAIAGLVGAISAVDWAQTSSEVVAKVGFATVDGTSSPPRTTQLEAALWLDPIAADMPPPPNERHIYTMLQKDKQFTPHLLLVPVGSTVRFPNADPFFHNVFSLFDGRRFDLGLYEAGSSKDVVFGREGISYIFCNIHPEMSAVIIALATPYYAVASRTSAFRIVSVPPGDYMQHLWVEGESQASLDAFTRKVRISAGRTDLGTMVLPQPPRPPLAHENKYGKAYDSPESNVY